jgi:hypothetical protein
MLCGLVLAISGVAHAQATYDALYLRGRVKELPEKKPGKLDVSDATLLRFTWEKGHWEAPFTQIKTVYVAMSRRSVLGEVFGLTGGAIAAAKKRKLLMSLTLTDESGASRSCVFFLYGPASPEFWKELEAKTGRSPVFESEEARKAAQLPD